MSQYIKPWRERYAALGVAPNPLIDEKRMGACKEAEIADLRAELSSRPDSGKVAEVFQHAMANAWQMVPKHESAPAGSYYKGETNGMIAALKTVEENFRIELGRAPAADSAATEECQCQQGQSCVKCDPDIGQQPVDRAATEQAEVVEKFFVGVSMTERGAQVAIHLKRNGITHVIYSQHHAAGRETAGIGYLPVQSAERAAEPSEADIDRMVLAVKHDGLASTDFEYVKRVFKAGMLAAAPASADVGELPKLPNEAVRVVIRNINSDSGEGWKPQDEEYYWAELLKAAGQASSAALPNEDTARLDFVIKNDGFIVWTEFDSTFKRCQLWTQDEDENHIIISGPKDRYFGTPREAIDAARAALSASAEKDGAA